MDEPDYPGYSPTSPERILEGLEALLSVPEISEGGLRRTIDLFPELLAPETDLFAQAIADLQSSSAAANSVLALAELLQACRRLGVDVALEVFKSEGPARAKARRLDEAVGEYDAERARRPRPSPAQLGHRQDDVFPSLNACVDYLERTYPQYWYKATAKSIESGDADVFEAHFPGYLYRGEPGVFPRTVSSLDRLLREPELPAATVEDIVLVTNRLERDLVAKGLAPLYARGFLQHYGLPTRYLDVTSKLEVALSFASDLAIGAVGAICVLPSDRIANVGQLIDLGHHPFAERPRSQAGYLIADPEGVNKDLKSPATVKRLGIEWIRFVMTEDDAARYRPDPAMLDAHSDRAAGLIELLIGSYGKIDDKAARWIADRLQPAPFVVRLLENRPDTSTRLVEWVSADEAGIPYVESDRRKYNYEQWSQRFPVTPAAEPPDELKPFLVDLDDVGTGATLHVLSPRALDSFPMLVPGGE